PGFDAVEKFFAFSHEPAPPRNPSLGDREFVLFNFRLMTGGQTSACFLTGKLRNQRNDPFPSVDLDAPNGAPGGRLVAPDAFLSKDTAISGQGVPRSGSIAWRDLGFVVLHFDSQISFGQSHTGIKSVEIRGVDSDGAEVMLGRWD